MGTARSVLILTHRFDPTADKVVEELNARDVLVFRCDASEFPERLSVGAELADGRWVGEVRTARRCLDLSGVSGIYYRRPTHFEFHPQLSYNERRWAAIQARIGFGGLLGALDYWLNHPHQISYAEYKPVQLRKAASCNLRVPRTLMTNDPQTAREFVSELGQAVCKPFGGSGVHDSDGFHQVFSSIVRPEHCDHPNITRTMHLFQQWIPKDYDVRLTVVDDQFFAVRIDSNSAAAQIDWRSDYQALSYTPIETPHSVRSRITELLHTLGLRFGAFDFSVASDEWWFLECNPTGSGRGLKTRPACRFLEPLPMLWWKAHNMTDVDALRTRFIDHLVASGTVRDPEWLAAFRDIPRAPFVPSFFRQVPEKSGWVLVEQPSTEWFDAVYSTQPLITQLDGDDTLTETARRGQLVTGVSTSSSSAPTLMAVMLHALDLHPGHRVLEIGTGTGYNAALLCHRVGAQNVTSVDVDPGVMDRARQRLAQLGYSPHLETTDGRAGCPERAPFDRVIATVALASVPVPWMDQTVPGGKLLVPLDRRNCGGLLALLTVHGDTAEGPFLPDYGGFMPVRPNRTDAADKAFREASEEDYRVHRVSELPATIITSAKSPFEFFAALTVPGDGWNQLEFIPADGGPVETWIATGDGSWVCHTTDNDGTHRVRQGGPTRLWDAIETAYHQWERLGKPSREHFGLTVRHDVHTIWLDKPTNPYRWNLTSR